MTRSAGLGEDDLAAVAAIVAEPAGQATPKSRSDVDALARQRVVEDRMSADASGVSMTPTFFINGRRYDGPWDAYTLGEAMLGSLGHRVHSAAIDFARWAPSTGVLLLLASALAVAITNSPLGPAFQEFWNSVRRRRIRQRAFRTVVSAMDQRCIAVDFLPRRRS